MPHEFYREQDLAKPLSSFCRQKRKSRCPETLLYQVHKTLICSSEPSYVTQRKIKTAAAAPKYEPRRYAVGLSTKRPKGSPRGCAIPCDGEEGQNKPSVFISVVLPISINLHKSHLPPGRLEERSVQHLLQIFAPQSLHNTGLSVGEKQFHT